MHKVAHRARTLLASCAVAGLIGLGASVAGAGAAKSQEIEPYEFVPAPAGTNLLLGYYIYGHDTQYSVSGGPTVKNSGLEVNIAIARYVHFFDLGGHPAVLQILQPFGSESAGHIDDQRLGSAFGAQNTWLGGAFWPYSNQATKTYVITDFFIYPPDGTYDPHSALNLGDNRWDGDVQIGISKGIGDHFSFDASFDTEFYGTNNNAAPLGGRLNQNPTYRGQIFLNWAWSKALSTSIGWEGFFGGREQLDGTFTGAKTEEQRIRAVGSLFLTPTFQTLLELNHDVQNSGGFKQDFGATLRVLYIF